MIRTMTLAWAVVALSAGLGSAQHVIVHSPPPAYVTYSPAPVVYQPAPVFAYSSPVVAYSAPAPVYASPAVTYSYYPATTVYSAPVAVAVPGVVTTRSYYGFGIFRPRGVYTESYYWPR